MQQTANYGFLKPEDNEAFDQQTHANANMDAIDTEIKARADDLAEHLADNVQDDDVHGLKTLFKGQQFNNLVANGDFKMWSLGLSNQWPDGWTGVQGHASNGFGREATTYLSSPYCAYLTKVDASSAMSTCQDITDSTVISRLRDKTIALSTNIKTTISPGVYGVIQCRDSSNALILGVSTSPHTGSGNFEQLTAKITIPANTAIIRIYSANIASSAATGTVWSDDVCLVQGSLPVAFADSQAHIVPAVSVYHSNNQSIAASTESVLAFDSELYDTDTIHDTATNSSRLICKTAGKYRATLHVIWGSDATGARKINIKKNGTTKVAELQSPPVNGGPVGQNLSVTVDLVVSDYLEAVVYQTSGGALNISCGITSGYTPTMFMLEKVC